MNAHTPTPAIRIEFNKTGQLPRGVVSGTLEVMNDGWNSESNRFLADITDAHPDFVAHLVKTCNAHDDLVAALRDMTRIATAASNGITGNQPRIEKARAALEKASMS
jgi:hypothetical protein